MACSDCLVNGNIVQRIAGAVEADDQAVADQLILAHALDIGEVLDARRRARGRSGTDQSPKQIAAAANAVAIVLVILLPNDELGPDHSLCELRAIAAAPISH